MYILLFAADFGDQHTTGSLQGHAHPHRYSEGFSRIEGKDKKTSKNMR